MPRFSFRRETALPPMADRYGSQDRMRSTSGVRCGCGRRDPFPVRRGGTDYFCELAGFEGEGVLFRVLYHTPTALEPDTAVTLYQGLPKGEKMDWILQKR